MTLTAVPEKIPDLRPNMVVEVVREIDVGSIDPGDRGRIVDGGPNARMMLFPRWHADGESYPLMDAAPHFETGAVKLVDVDVNQSAKYEKQRSEAAREALKSLSFDTTELNLRKAEARGAIDLAVYKVVAAVPGILACRIALSFVSDEHRDERAILRNTFSAVQRVVKSGMVRAIPAKPNDDDPGWLRLYPVPEESG